MKLVLTLILFTFYLGGCSQKQGVVNEQMTDRASVQYQFAYDFFQSGDTVRAQASALRALEHSPNNADIRNLLGLIYFRRGEYPEAKEQFMKAAELSPNMSEVYTNLGSLYYEMELYEEALEALTKGLNNPLYLHPERIHNNKALVLEALGRVDEAIEEYQRAIFLRDTYYLPYQNLGKLLIKEGRADHAKPYLEEAVKLCENCVEARYHLGSVLKAKNLQEEALKVFREGYEINPRSYYGQLCGEQLSDHE